jgi:hypothetical protein
MTTLGINATVTRETRATYRGRALIVELSAHEVTLREKGRRLRVSVPLLAIYDLGFRLLAKQAAPAKKGARK